MMCAKSDLEKDNRPLEQHCLQFMRADSIAEKGEVSADRFFG